MKHKRYGGPFLWPTVYITWQNLLRTFIDKYFTCFYVSHMCVCSIYDIVSIWK